MTERISTLVLKSFGIPRLGLRAIRQRQLKPEGVLLVGISSWALPNTLETAASREQPSGLHILQSAVLDGVSLGAAILLAQHFHFPDTHIPIANFFIDVPKFWAIKGATNLITLGAKRALQR